MKKLACFLLILLSYGYVYSQELNAKVQVLAPNVSNINKKNLEDLQTVIRDFLNNNKWTNDTYLPQERIDCNFVLTLTGWDGNSSYSAEAQIQSSRPVFGSSYFTTLLNMNDKDFDFSYNQGQTLDFSEQNFITNLSSLLAYYAYTIIGLDKDSFSKLGGELLYNKAQSTLNIAQTAGSKGWKAFDGLRNRYWLNENLLNNSFQELRVFIYNFHLNGLDLLQENQTNALKKIVNSLSLLQQMDKQKLGSIFPNVYFASKADEIVNVLSLAEAQDRIKAYNFLSVIDPANISKYEGLKK
ncbi:type IX secretion system protein PorD [Pedobacter insulae]|uniref:DUF4835 domain-containing protein n=1 Tax=Pedobacter insulae TaxID=414048 RepID=A0A1I2XSA6_9SPHI|nr:DUF4835 family protein [Pedobacter insulae]SFH16353.1 protein of unknown function [Pedobacter insulae]